MNKYEKLMNTLRDEYEEAYSDYSSKKRKANNNAQKQCNSYNDNIHRINSTRDNLLEEISSLYKFLKRFGDVGKKITPFDYVNETSRSVENYVDSDHLKYNDDCHSTSGFVKTAAAVSIVTVPILAPAILIGDAFHKRSKCREEYLKMLDDFEEQKLTWEKDIKDKKDEAEFYESASNIAYIYQSLIMTVRQAIKETILPELSGIDAFLIADAIKNNIISDMDPTDAEIANISMYKDTIYNCHYTFVMNAFDFYTMIVKFFSEPILTKMMDDNVITSQEKANFSKKKKLIENKTKEMSDSAVFGGEV